MQHVSLITSKRSNQAAWIVRFSMNVSFGHECHEIVHASLHQSLPFRRLPSPPSWHVTSEFQRRVVFHWRGISTALCLCRIRNRLVCVFLWLVRWIDCHCVQLFGGVTAWKLKIVIEKQRIKDRVELNKIETEKDLSEYEIILSRVLFSNCSNGC